MIFHIDDGESCPPKRHKMTEAALAKQPLWVQELARSAKSMPNTWVASSKFCIKATNP